MPSVYRASVPNAQHLNPFLMEIANNRESPPLFPEAGQVQAQGTTESVRVFLDGDAFPQDA